ncbi:MAG: hypothetical protein AB7Q17_14990 [Phycisphaerae bacterium]
MNGRNYVIVGQPAATTAPGQVFIFDIADPSYVPTAPATPTQTIVLPEIGEKVRSTPLVLQNRWVVLQTDRRLLAYDLSPLPGAPVFKWSSATLRADRASPATGQMNRLQVGGYRVFALGDGKVVSIDPAIEGQGRAFEMDTALRADPNGQETFSCPAIGPLDPSDDLYATGVNLLYCSTFSSSPGDHVFAVFSDNVARGEPARVVAWSTKLIVYPKVHSGTFTSPSVHSTFSPLAGAVVVGGDDGGLYGLRNRTGITGDAVRRWVSPIRAGDCLSHTTAVTHHGDILYYEEGAAVWQWRDAIDTAAYVDELPLVADRPIWGAPAVDPYRFYVGTEGAQGEVGDGRQVIAVCYRQGGFRELNRTWVYRPAERIADHWVRQEFRSTIAVNSDATLLAVNDGFLFAIRPLRADFNGDGCRNNFDVDAFALAITDPDAWEQNYGAPYGINRVGVGDCNGDGVVNNIDIDCFVDLVVADPRCVPEFLGPCPSGEPGGGESAARGETGEPADDRDWAYFYATVAALRALFDMD